MKIRPSSIFREVRANEACNTRLAPASSALLFRLLAAACSLSPPLLKKKTAAKKPRTQTALRADCQFRRTYFFSPEPSNIFFSFIIPRAKHGHASRERSIINERRERERERERKMLNIMPDSNETHRQKQIRKWIRGCFPTPRESLC